MIGRQCNGSIKKDLPKGSQVVTVRALQTDGTSRGYRDFPSVSCSEFLTRNAKACADGLGGPEADTCVNTVRSILPAVEGGLY